MQKRQLSLEIELPLKNDLVVIDKNNPNSQNFLEYIHTLSHIVVFSPHLDDAVLSAGSLISYATKKGIDVEVITIFSESTDLISTATKTLLRNAEFDNAKEYFIERRAEDIIALKELGVEKVRHLNYIDSAWRSGENGKSLYDDSQLASIDNSDKKLKSKLIQEIKKIVIPSEKTGIFAPVGRGKHVDHQLTRDIVKEIFPQTIFFEDFPYSAYFESEDAFVQDNHLTPIEWKGNYEAKKNAILQYKTQRYSLFYKGVMHLPYERYFFKIK